jgi:hypothetical protein
MAAFLDTLRWSRFLSSCSANSSYMAHQKKAYSEQYSDQMQRAGYFPDSELHSQSPSCARPEQIFAGNNTRISLGKILNLPSIHSECSPVVGMRKRTQSWILLG